MRITSNAHSAGLTRSVTFESMRVLQTERLTLRPLQASDIHAILAMEADPDVMRYTTGPISPDAQRRQQLLDHMQSQNQLGHWAIDQGSGFIGWVSLTTLENDGRHQVAYRLTAQAWGQGYATEAAEAVIQHGFELLDISEIIAVVWPQNQASIRVLSKLSFQFEEMTDYFGKEVELHVRRRRSSQHVQ